jgi:hypothetical protein
VLLNLLKDLLFPIVVFLSTFFIVVVAWKKPKGKKNRTKSIWKLLIFNCVVFSIGLLALTFLLPQTVLTIFSWIVFDFLISYVFCIELPAWFRISKFDDNLGDALKDLRAELVMMPFDFDTYLEKLDLTKKRNALLVLEEENLENLMQNFIDFSHKLDRFNENFWNLTLSELTGVIEEVSRRSKHPFPKLIDILALSGLSILLAQLLKLLE